MKSMKLNGEARRRVPYGTQAGACSLKVPLFTDSPEGEWLEGLIRVPARLARATPDTNEKHGFDRLVREQLKRWNDYREARGWKMNSRPQVRGPYDPPTPNAGDEPLDEAVVWYFALARFVRTEPLWKPLDEVLDTLHWANVYDVKPKADPLPWNDLSGKADTGWVDPMVEAEEERQRRGLRRKDFLSGKIWEPYNQKRAARIRKDTRHAITGAR